MNKMNQFRSFVHSLKMQIKVIERQKYFSIKYLLVSKEANEMSTLKVKLNAINQLRYCNATFLGDHS